MTGTINKNSKPETPVNEPEKHIPSAYVTAAAIAEGHKIVSDPDAKGYNSIDDLKAALEA